MYIFFIPWNEKKHDWMKHIHQVKSKEIQDEETLAI